MAGRRRTRIIDRDTYARDGHARHVRTVFRYPGHPRQAAVRYHFWIIPAWLFPRLRRRRRR